MPDIWYSFLHRFARTVYFARVAVVHPERLPKAGPVLFLGLHRNGAVDGIIYGEVLRGVVFLISSQLRRTRLARLFFNGIAITRGKDQGDRSQNDMALKQCLQHLSSGGQLFVFPEGTSSLGPRHLPFKGAAAWLIEDYLRGGGPPLQVIPVGIHYECAWAFRSKVEVVIGRPVSTDLAGKTPFERITELRGRITKGLQEVGVNVASAEYQQQIQQLAYISTLATPRSYFRSLKALEAGIPPAILEPASKLEPNLRGRRLWRHQGVPLFPMGSRWLYLLALGALSPVVLVGILLNLPPFLAGWFAGAKFADDTNVISLWKMMVGVSLFAIWSAAATVSLLLTHPILALPYLALTGTALWLYYRVKKLAVAVHNGFRYPEAGPRLLAFRESVLAALPGETDSTNISNPRETTAVI